MTSFTPAACPTDPEVAQLLALVPTSRTPSPPLNEALAELIAACRFPTAFDFLINPDADPLSVLTAPLNRHNAVASHVSISALSPPTPHSGPTDTPVDSFFVGNYAFIPAFSIADIQLGFGIRECKTHVNGRPIEHPCSLTSRTNVFRFIRNDSAHVLIIVQDLDEPLVKIEYMRLVTGCMRRRNFFVITRSGLIALHRSHSPFEPSQLAPHVLVFRTSIERRQCPICGNQPSSAPCFCVIDVPKSRHALDFSIMNPGMCAHLGSYEGSAVVMFSLQGLNMPASTVANRMIISEVDEELDLIDRLSRCVITEQLSKSPGNPLKDMLLRPIQISLNPSQPEYASNTDGSSSSTNSVRSLSVSNPSPALPLTLEQASALLSFYCDPKTGASSIGSDPTEELNVSMSNPGQLDIPPQKLSQMLPSANSPFLASDEAGDNHSWMSPQFGNTPEAPVAHPIISEALQFPSTVPMDEELALTNLITPQDLSTYMQENALVISNGMPQSRPQPVPIAPSSQLAAPETPETKTQEERERRAELRRQRNREAAHRSNVKRKVKNDALKADLKKWNGKVKQLRRVEVGLREENLKLRKLLSEG
ncbi:unnamed protein product [Agarophyton chilense]